MNGDSFEGKQQAYREKLLKAKQMTNDPGLHSKLDRLLEQSTDMKADLKATNETVTELRIDFGKFETKLDSTNDKIEEHEKRRHKTDEILFEKNKALDEKLNSHIADNNRHVDRRALSRSGNTDNAQEEAEGMSTKAKVGIAGGSVGGASVLAYVLWQILEKMG